MKSFFFFIPTQNFKMIYLKTYFIAKLNNIKC
jgi:hypothetical protein